MCINLNKVAIEQADLPNASPVFSNMIVSGDKVYLSGVIGTNDSGKLVAGGVQAETTQALETASKRLELLGLDLSDVVSVTIYVNNYADNIAGLNEAYVKAFPKRTSLPVRAAVGVAALPLNAAAEFSIIATKRTSVY